jgi:small ubiquitin-related modifier
MLKVKRTTKMEKVFEAYAGRKGVDIHGLRFLLDGERVSFDDTPEELELKDGDQIDVWLSFLKEEATTNASGSEAAASENVNGTAMASEVTSNEKQNSENSDRMTIFVDQQ